MKKAPEQYRVKTGRLASYEADGNNGCFLVPFRSAVLQVIASDGVGWDHVSVSLPNRNPNWEEMCFIKDLFFHATECALQYHPPQDSYVNVHEHCLHLWRPHAEVIPRPPIELV